LLGNLIDHACIWAKSRVLVTLRDTENAVEIPVEDDGPGTAPADRALALARGGRIDEKVPGTALGQPIVGDLVELHRGTWPLDGSPIGGLAAQIRLPLPSGPSATLSKRKAVAAA
jgi:signal transduction histidine kinase